MKLTIETYQNTLTHQSRRILEAALRHLLINTLHVKIANLKVSWHTTHGTDDTSGVTFKSTVDMEGGGIAELSGHAILDGTTLSGLEGIYSVMSNDRQDHQKEFKLIFSPLAALYILSEARKMEEAEHPARKEAPRPSVPDTDTEDGWPYELFDDDILDQRDVFNFPYAFKTPGQMDFCIGGVIACMERTIIELMNCQDKYLDSIDIPSDVCPGITSVYVKPAQCTDILYARLAAKTTDGNHTETTFCQLGADTAADITRHILRNYEKKPLFFK